MADLFMVYEPLAGRRHVRVTDRRNRVDFARVIQALTDALHHEADKIGWGGTI